MALWWHIFQDASKAWRAFLHRAPHLYKWAPIRALQSHHQIDLESALPFLLRSYLFLPELKGCQTSLMFRPRAFSQLNWLGNNYFLYKVESALLCASVSLCLGSLCSTSFGGLYISSWMLKTYLKKKKLNVLTLRSSLLVQDWEGILKVGMSLGWLISNPSFLCLW